MPAFVIDATRYIETFFNPSSIIVGFNCCSAICLQGYTVQSKTDTANVLLEFVGFSDCGVISLQDDTKGYNLSDSVIEGG